MIEEEAHVTVVVVVAVGAGPVVVIVVACEIAAGIATTVKAEATRITRIARIDGMCFGILGSKAALVLHMHSYHNDQHLQSESSAGNWSKTVSLWRSRWGLDASSISSLTELL